MDKDTRREVRSYYELGWEKDRLKTGKGHAHAIEGDVEKTRTTLLLKKYLPHEKSVILDVGGASGAYAFWLASLGHSVHLLDLTPLHIDQSLAEQEKPSSPRLASCQVQDACDLEFPDNFADVVLCMGPLYHLPKDSERKKCLEEAFRVLKQGGMIFAVAISRFASLHDHLRTGAFYDEKIFRLIEHDIKTGCHVNSEKDHRLFTTAFFHRPEDLRREIENARFSNTIVLAIEGPILLTKNLSHYWADTSSNAMLLSLAEQVEREEALMGISNHIAAIGYKL